MKKLLLVSFFALSYLYADSSVVEQDEINTLTELINATKRNLHSQQNLLKMVIEFKQARSAFMNDPSSAKLATLLVKKAMCVHQEIEKEHLTHLFSSSFLSEIIFFNQIGEQQHLIVKREN